MKKRILMFLLSCIMLVTLCATLVNCNNPFSSHNVTFYVDGVEYFAQDVYSETEIQVPADPSRADYDFDGWYYDQDTWKNKFDPTKLKSGHIDNDIKLYAKWVPHTHRVDNGALTKVDGKFYFTGSCRCGTSYDGNVNAKETVIVKPTCLAEGSSKYTYILLGVEYSITEVTPKGNHLLNNVDVSTLVDENGYFPDDTKGIYLNKEYIGNFKCGDTAEGKFVCSYCNCYLDITVIKSHKYDVWTMVQVGLGENEYYQLSTKCSRSDCGQDYTCIAEDRYLTDSNVVPSTCKAQGSKTVTYNNDKILVSCNAVIDKLPHTLNGHTMNNYATTNGAYNYYNSVNGVDVVFDNLYANLNDKPQCGEVTKSYFECEECKGLVYIEIYKNHKYGKAEIIVPATCTTTGLSKSTCVDCKITTENVVKALGHNHVYSLIRMEDSDNDLTNDQFLYTHTCKRCGDMLSTKTVVYDDVSHSIVSPTCVNKGYHIYSYGGKPEDPTYAEYKVAIPTNEDHILNGVIAHNVYAGKDGVIGDGYSYRYSIEGINVTINSGATCSVKTGQLYNGYYICEAEGCGGVVYVDVYVDHVGERTTITEPTCGKEGLAKVDCKYCGEGQKTPISATGLHEYTYTIGFTPSEGVVAVTKYEVIAVCKVCKYQDRRFEIEASDITIEIKTPVTCQDDGVLSYTYKNGDIVAYGERVYALKGEHHLNGEIIADKLHTYVVDGVSYECIESNVDGVILPAGKQYRVGEVVMGIFICDTCNVAIEVQVIVVDSGK